MNTTAADPDFRSKRRLYPRWIVNFLAVTALLYGVALCFILPWAVLAALFPPDIGTGSRGGPAAIVWGVFLTAVSVSITIRWLSVQAFAFYEHDRVRRTPVKPLVNAPFVSILVPAYNESNTVIQTVGSLIALDYPDYEIILVDDGSTDDTFVKAFSMAGTYPNCTIRAYTKPNGGKWSALNFAYQKAKGDLLLCVDADSGLARDALRVLVPRIAEKGVVGVSGQVTIRNRHNFLTRLQAAEYLLANGGMRMALSLLGTVTLVPGPIGLYKREILERIARLPCNRATAGTVPRAGDVDGPLSGETFAEDFQLSLSALALGGRIVYEPRAYAYTKCPDDVASLLSQRYRWIRGTWQVYMVYMRKIRGLARAERKTKTPLLHAVMMVLYPVDIFLVPVLNIAFWGSIGISAAFGQSMLFIMGWVGSVALLNFMTAIIYILEQDDELILAPLVAILDLYSLLVNSAWVIAGIDESRGTRMRWS
jgi:biofilm PGA synthesis N-glycosyltransferase PgaC